MGKFFANIIILPMLGYFQTIIGLLFINLNYFTLHYLRLFMFFFNYLWLFFVISPEATFGYCKLFLVILCYF